MLRPILIMLIAGCSIAQLTPPRHDRWDEFPKLRDKELQARVDILGIWAQKKPGVEFVLELRFPANASRSYKLQRAERIIKALEKRKFNLRPFNLLLGPVDEWERTIVFHALPRESLSDWGYDPAVLIKAEEFRARRDSLLR